jgi:hypothetical protein
MATIVERVPPLDFGDKLTAEEFLRRWEAHPEIKRAELIGGMVFMSSPISIDHGDMEGIVGGLVFVYSVATAGTASGHATTTFLLDDVPQPDLNLRILPEYGGTSWEEDNYLHGAPELLVEISRSSSAYDLHVKQDLYQAAKVPEYLAVLLFEQEIRWHILVDGEYQLLKPGKDGVWRSRIFPGLWLDGKALLTRNMQQVLARLQQGLDSPEHRQFVTELEKRRAARKKG